MAALECTNVSHLSRNQQRVQRDRDLSASRITHEPLTNHRRNFELLGRESSSRCDRPLGRASSIRRIQEIREPSDYVILRAHDNSSERGAGPIAAQSWYEERLAAHLSKND